MVRRAIEGGVNYIDTGRVYLGGESEQTVGRALAGGWRDRVYVTSKMPWWEMRSADDFEKFFDQSRRTIGTDVIDFYHIHMIMHRAWKDYVLPYRLIEKMERLKAQGKIRFMGFSFHDSLQRALADYTVSMSPVQRGDPASSCVACGECLAKCPQHLDIPNLLARVRETMGK